MGTREGLMQGLSRQRALEHLRARIESIEKRFVPKLGSAEPKEPGFAIPSGMVHEVFSDALRDAGAALGFALAGARGLRTSDRPAVLYLQLMQEAQEMGFPYAPGLMNFGIPSEMLIFIRPGTIVELLWAVEEALACPAIAAVIADVAGDPKALDFAASRRLSLRTAAGGGTVLILRYGIGRTATAARLRWHVTPAVSADQPFDPRAPGESRWRVKLEKGLWKGRNVIPPWTFRHHTGDYSVPPCP